MKRRVLMGAGVAAAAVAAGAGFSLYRSKASATDDVPELWQLSFEQPGGGSLAMAALRGKPMLLNFWATWCAPCIREMPMLNQFHRDRQASGWQVVGLAVDSPTPVREFLTRLPVAFPIGLAGMEGAELSRKLGNINGSLPFTVVFDADGRVIARKLGAVSAAELDSWAKKGGTQPS